MSLTPLTALLVSALVLGWGSVQTVADSESMHEPPPVEPLALPTRPNIVVVLTDDMNRADLRWMPKTRRLIGGHGVRFVEALSPAPLCCPARAELVTGQYGHNNGVLYNGGPFGGYQALRQKDNTIGPWLHGQGYQTALVGKYLNGYPEHARLEPGWTHWNPVVDRIYRYTRTTFFDDGAPKVARRVVTAEISTYAARYVREFSERDKPFFLWVSHLAPHARTIGSGADRHWVPPLATRRHRNELAGAQSPSLRKPSFNRHPGRGHSYDDFTLKPRSAAATQRGFVGRLQALQDVDDSVQRLVRVLRKTGELDNTVVMFLSDNGILSGEHQIAAKNVLFREALEIPLLVRMPGHAGARTSQAPVTITDLTATILELSGARPGREQDGTSFVPILAGGTMLWRDTQLVQTGSRDHGFATRGTWTRRYTYVRRVTDGHEYLYDRQRDPHEINDVAGWPAYGAVLGELRHRLDALADCTGDACDRRFGPLPGARHQ